MPDRITTALGRSERQFRLRSVIGLTLLTIVVGSFAIAVGWLAFDFGYQLAQNQGRPIVIVVHTATP